MAYGFQTDDGAYKIGGSPSETEEVHGKAQEPDTETWNPDEETYEEFERRTE